MLPRGLSSILPSAMLDLLGDKADDKYQKILESMASDVNKKIVEGNLEFTFDAGDGLIATLHSISFETHHIVVLEGADTDGIRVRRKAFFRGSMYQCKCSESSATEGSTDDARLIKIPEEVQVLIDNYIVEHDGKVQTEREGRLAGYFKELRGIIADKRVIEIGTIYHVLDNDGEPRDDEYYLVNGETVCEDSGIRDFMGFTVSSSGYRPAKMPIWRIGKPYIEQ